MTDQVAKIIESKQAVVVGVVKSVDATQAYSLLDVGINNFGENRLAGLVEKQALIIDKEIVWHFIGRLQTKQIKEIVPRVTYIHSLAHLKHAAEINKVATHTVKCFVQVNTTSEWEDSKEGVLPSELIDFVCEVSQFEKIEVVGLMTMAMQTEDVDKIRQSFHNLSELQRDVQKLNIASAPCGECSMGMSNDFEIALAEGATMLRLGRVLFDK